MLGFSGLSPTRRLTEGFVQWSSAEGTDSKKPIFFAHTIASVGDRVQQQIARQRNTSPVLAAIRSRSFSSDVRPTVLSCG
jgi:hypothetical protein